MRKHFYRKSEETVEPEPRFPPVDEEEDARFRRVNISPFPEDIELLGSGGIAGSASRKSSATPCKPCKTYSFTQRITDRQSTVIKQSWSVLGSDLPNNAVTQDGLAGSTAMCSAASITSRPQVL
jgi:hypothetical protein